MQLESTPGDENDMLAAGELIESMRSRRRFLGGTAATATAALVLAAARDAEAAVTLPQLYPGQNRSIFHTIQNDENSHTNYLIGLLGVMSRPKPIFRNLVTANVRLFAARASQFEVIAARAYTAALPYINSPGFLSGAIRIGMVEARHSSFINALVNHPLVPARLAFEPPMGQMEVVGNISPFIASLSGGPDPAYELLRSDTNDINILNFLLLLAYLESEFYNVNVPRFAF